jgi:hypothetical protein
VDGEEKVAYRGKQSDIEPYEGAGPYPADDKDCGNGVAAMIQEIP